MSEMVQQSLPSRKGQRLERLPGLLRRLMRFRSNWTDAELAAVAVTWCQEAKDQKRHARAEP